MSLRSKLLLAQAPLALALLVVGLLGRYTVSTLAHRSQDILKDNQQSVLAAQRMRDHADDLARLILLAPRDAERGAEVERLRGAFSRDLAFQQGNVTEQGEQGLTDELAAAWRALDAAQARPAPPPELLAALDRLERASDAVVSVNEDAMVRKSQLATRIAARVSSLLLGATGIAALLGALATTALTARLVRPLGVLTQAVRRVGQGDLEARARVDGGDEIALLAREFNTMTDRLASYRRSSLGDLLQAQQAAQATIDSLADPVLVLDFTGSVQSANAAAESLLGISVDGGPEAWAKVDPAVRALVDGVRVHVAAGRGAFTPRGLEEATVIQFPDAARALLPRASPVLGEAGSPVAVAIVLQDVTRLRRFDELKNDLVATVAHEFRTPLTSLRMAVHLLAEGVVGPLDEKQADLVQAAREDCDRLQGIVDDLLDLSRIQSGRLEVNARPIPARVLVEDALAEQRLLAEERGVALAAEGRPPERPVLADPERARLVLANLVTNALRHTPRGGSVTLRAESLPEQVRFSVEDTGAGIAAEHLPHLFERFYRVPGAPSGGAGLGLYITHEIVRAHGGELGVQSEPGRGARFWFTLPAV